MYDEYFMVLSSEYVPTSMAICESKVDRVVVCEYTVVRQLTKFEY